MKESRIRISNAPSELPHHRALEWNVPQKRSMRPQRMGKTGFYFVSPSEVSKRVVGRDVLLRLRSDTAERYKYIKSR